MENKTDSIPVMKKRPGARIGHKGHHRPVPDHVDEECGLTNNYKKECETDLILVITPERELTASLRV